MLSYVFFFQAEDGIRDLTVTGVQTCALPISYRMGIVQGKLLCEAVEQFALDDAHPVSLDVLHKLHEEFALVREAFRSEERRVGKECRSRWSANRKSM